MGVIKEWNCNDCNNEFDSDVSICPSCSSIDVARAFRTSPGFKSDNSKNKDFLVRDALQSYGLSDYSNNESTKHTKDTSNLWQPLSSFTPSMEGGDPSLLKDASKHAREVMRKSA